MKNENDTTATKKKNEDFFKELNKDREEKNVNMRCLYLYWSQTVNYTIQELWMCPTNIPKCMSFVPSFSFQSLPCLETLL